MAKCWSCGTIYDTNLLSWHGCPSCALKEKTEQTARQTQEEISLRIKEEAEETRRAIETAEDEMEATMEQVTEEQRRIAADGWKLAAQSKVNRAIDLLNAKLYSEAADLAQKVLKEDPGNLRGYLVFAHALDNLGDTRAAFNQWRNAIQLLGREDYRVSDHYVEAAKVMPYPREEISENDISFFVTKLRELSAESPQLIYPDLIEMLARRGLVEIASFLAKNISVPNITDGLMHTLLELELPEIALILAERMTKGPRESDATDLSDSTRDFLLKRYLGQWVNGLCWLLELQRKIGIGNPRAAVTEMSWWNFSNGTKLLEYLKENKQILDCFSPETIEQAKVMFAEIYNRLRPEILQDINRSRKAKVKETVLNGLGLFLVTVFIGVIVGAIARLMGLSPITVDILFCVSLLIPVIIVLRNIRDQKEKMFAEEEELLAASGLAGLVLKKCQKESTSDSSVSNQK